MKIACVILGTRGDVQPMIALGSEMVKKGHEVVICAPPENEILAKSNNCKFIAFGPEVQKSVKENPEKQKGGVAVKFSPKKGKKLILDQITKLPELLKGVDLILGVGIVIGVHSSADILNVPYRLVAFYPIILGTTKDDPAKNRMMFKFGRQMMNLMLKSLVNKERVKNNLPKIDDIWQHWLGEEVIIASDKELNPAKQGTAFKFVQTAFMTLNSEKELNQEIENFLNSGSAPVYIGFGSNPIMNTEKFNNIFENVQKNTKQRLIISKGWADFPTKNSENILYIDDVPFEKLFPRISAVIFHGGTGTMAAIARAGKPMAAFPFMGDQFDNRNQIVKLELGPKTCDFKKITEQSISDAITECISNENYKKNITELSLKLKQTNGVELTINQIEKILK